MKAHDIRKMHQCGVCKTLGVYKPEPSGDTVPLVILQSNYDFRFIHPRCLIRKGGLKALLQQNKEELGRIRICDVSRRALNAVLNQISKPAASKALA